MTSPALLESTSLVLGMGVDLFFTRVSPSGEFDVLGEGFNKVQLLATIFALAIGLMVMKPLVRRKLLKQRWNDH
jgi:ER membrane protein complex subunit 1